MNFHDFFILLISLVFFVIHTEAYSLRSRFFENGHESKRELRESSEYFPSVENNAVGSSYGYRDTNEWIKTYPTCGGRRQSPINLNSYDMTRLAVPMRLKWRGYRKQPNSMTFVNNGHSVELSGEWNADETPYIYGSALDGEYIFAQLHFHWGPHDGIGSEHTINNRSLPLEMHMVHYKRDYGSMSEAVKHEDGLAVIGILFEINNAFSNSGIYLLQRFIGSIKIPDTRIAIKPFPLSQFHLNFPEEYVAYLGSLTTPPCSEIVTWILPAIPRFLNEEQMNLFRSVELANGDDRNFRPPQPRNGRIIYYISS